MSAPRLADLAEQVIVAVLYVFLVWRLLPDPLAVPSFYRLMLILSEGVIVGFILARRPTDRFSMNPRDWAIAFGGTLAGLLVGPGGEPISVVAGTTFLCLGLAIHLGAKLSLRRSFGLVAADRGVMVGGFYRFVRHPMYFGYFVAHCGYLLAAPSLWNLSVYLANWALLAARILAEEKVLKQNPEYVAYAEQVRYRVIPGVF
ncbi:MAG: isoprenylcysteine carboxylmethyltransferase family protein [Maricaulaceae bacterium]